MFKILVLITLYLISYQMIITMTTTDAAIMDTTNKTITKTIVPVVERPLVELSFVGLVTTIVAF